jgi:group I intron endonuclease
VIKPNPIPSTPGVYCLWNKISNKVYVGSAKNLNARINRHFYSHCQNPHLKRSIKKHGKENFSVTWYETEDLFQEEQRLLDYVFTLGPGATFNVAVKAGGNPGGTIERQRELCEAGGGSKSVPLFLICTKTSLITKIESASEGARLGFGSHGNLSNFSKPNSLKRVKTCLVAKSVAEAKAKLEAWLFIPGNNPIVLKLPEGTKQSTLWKLANVNKSNFSSMYRKVLSPSTGEPLIQAMQSKLDFSWYGTEVKTGDWFRCTKSSD